MIGGKSFWTAIGFLSWRMTPSSPVWCGHIWRAGDTQFNVPKILTMFWGEFTAFAPQLVLLDISLPFFNGYHWCAEIRRVSNVPIIFLSSASDNMNLITAMNMGGDDFLSKPFELPVLTAKIQALLRRTYDFGSAVQLLQCGGAVLNMSDGTLRVHGETLDLTRNEWKILQQLLENRGKVVSRQALMTHLWESDAFISENTLTVNVTRLRKKLEAAGLSDFIRTKKGVGYLVG